MFSILLSRISTPLKEFDLIAGRCVDRELDEVEEKIFKEFINSPDYTTETVFMFSGHCTYSWDMVLEYGLIGLKDKVDNDAKTKRRGYF